jgi:hypothetical protein
MSPPPVGLARNCPTTITWSSNAPKKRASAGKDANV